MAAGVPQSEVEKLVADAFHAIGADHDRPDVSKGPGMHLTSTVDVIVLIKGSVRLVLDEEETVLQRATSLSSVEQITRGSARGRNGHCSWRC